MACTHTPPCTADDRHDPRCKGAGACSCASIARRVFDADAARARVIGAATRVT